LQLIDHLLFFFKTGMLHFWQKKENEKKTFFCIEIDYIDKSERERERE
jgi:hypothetical protein